MNYKTDVTIISTNINKKILDNFNDYIVIDQKFNLEDLWQYKNIIFFNVLHFMTDEEVKNLFKMLKDKNINFINFTNDLEEALFTSYLVVYDKENILVGGNTIEVLKCEKLLKRVGLQLPFIVELSLLLKDYGLLDEIYLDKERLKDKLWN